MLLLLSHFSRVWLCVTPPWDSPGKNTGVSCHFLLQCMKVKSESEVTQSCLTLSDPMDCSPPGSSIHGIFQERILEWGAIAFSDRNCLVRLIVTINNSHANSKIWNKGSPGRVGRAVKRRTCERGKASLAEPLLIGPQGLLPPGGSRLKPLLIAHVNTLWPQTRPSKWQDKGNRFTAKSLSLPLLEDVEQRSVRPVMEFHVPGDRS